MDSVARKVLIADDSQVARKVQEIMLKDLQLTILSAGDGQEAVECARRDRPDLILMDVTMPRMTGIEATKVLRGEEATKNTPIIIVTTKGRENEIRLGFEAGCNDYVTKPIDVIALKAKIRALLWPDARRE